MVLEKVLPAELEGRGIPQPADLCKRLAALVDSLPDDAPAETPDTVFQRLAGTQ